MKIPLSTIVICRKTPDNESRARSQRRQTRMPVRASAGPVPVPLATRTGTPSGIGQTEPARPAYSYATELDVSIGHARRTTMVPGSGMRIVGLIVALGCLVAAPQLHAERMNHSGDQGNHERMSHQGGHHYDHRRYAGGGYDGGDVNPYGPPPMVYAPAPAPGVSLFMPLRLR
ncbi:hypothetical protein [Burkholderia sp. D-99]|uniref:hypothetical protein n=1 Tax=Burkholderia sp. D-99 TaxID=2717316 RepID=UPI001FB74B7E|nr:hypothetical protein [Burkholderia sp. D-99]